MYFNHQKLKCYKVSLDVAKSIPTLTNRWPRGHAYLIDQLKRAVSSICLNICEGNAKFSTKERRRFFVIARASVAEVSAIMDVSANLNLISEAIYMSTQDRLVQISKMLYRLIKPRF